MADALDLRSHWLVAAIVEHVAGEHRGPVRVGDLSYADCERLVAALRAAEQRAADAEGQVAASAQLFVNRAGVMESER